MFDPATGKMIPPRCPASTWVALDPTLPPHRIECEIPDLEHPNQAHLSRVESTEAFVEAFIGWWDDAPRNEEPGGE